MGVFDRGDFYTLACRGATNLHGDPASELTRVATDQHALVIVLGTRGEGVRQALSRLIEPSVSHGVIGRQHRPVLVVPSPE
jgi:nucleotide-binding universal stress UspA family protein